MRWSERFVPRGNWLTNAFARGSTSLGNRSFRECCPSRNQSTLVWKRSEPREANRRKTLRSESPEYMHFFHDVCPPLPINDRVDEGKRSENHRQVTIYWNWSDFIINFPAVVWNQRSLSTWAESRWLQLDFRLHDRHDQLIQNRIFFFFFFFRKTSRSTGRFARCACLFVLLIAHIRRDRSTLSAV